MPFFAIRCCRPIASFPATEPYAADPLRFIPVSGGASSIGHDGPDFSFDNERPRHQILLIAISYRVAACHKHRIQNLHRRRRLHRRPEFWLSDGWTKAQEENWQAPLYWLSDDDGSVGEGGYIFTLSGAQPLDPHAPVEHVSFYEAAAYASWANARLPTEFEWEVAAPSLDYGNVWEWTRSAFLDPYPGFRSFEGVTRRV